MHLPTGENQPVVWKNRKECRCLKCWCQKEEERCWWWSQSSSEGLDHAGLRDGSKRFGMWMAREAKRSFEKNLTLFSSWRDHWLPWGELTLKGRIEEMGPLTEACSATQGEMLVWRLWWWQWAHGEVVRKYNLMEELLESGDVLEGRNKGNRSQRNA